MQLLILLAVSTLPAESQPATSRTLAVTADLDGDGVAELVTADRVVGQVVVRAQGRVLHRFAGRRGELFGCSVAVVGDVDEDGWNDILVGAPMACGAGRRCGRAVLYSGRSGVVLRELEGSGERSRFGHAVAAAGDVDGDGCPDLLIGAFGEFVGGERRGSARVFSGADGVELLALYGEVSGERFGFTVAGAGDVDGDGHADCLVTAPLAGRELVYSGRDGSLLGGYPAEARGSARTTASSTPVPTGFRPSGASSRSSCSRVR